MKKLIIIIFAAALLLLPLCGCDTLIGNDGKINVYTSIYPMYDFTSKIAGDKANVKNLVPFGIEPHDYEPYPADIAALEKADVFIYSGVGMEHWVDDVLASLKTTRLAVIESSKSVELLSSGAHDDGDDHGDFDPHVWLSPKNAKKQMENIKNALASADPDNAEYYEANYKNQAEKLDELDAEFSSALSGLENKTIIVSHKAFGYLCRDYGLNQLGISGLSSEDEPDPGRMAELVGLAREHKITTIFFEELASPKVAQAIASEIGAKTAILSPIEGPGDSGGDYFSIMRQNLAELVKALTKG